MTDGELGGESIFRTKIVRPPVKNLINRERLYEFLDRGGARKLTIVSAPAGYGKTSLVASWLAKRSLDSCWVSLGRLDGSAQQLTTYLEAALDRLENREGGEGSKGLAAFLNALSARRGETFVILDDFHLAECAEVNDLVMFLLDHLPSTAHLFIITRTDPTLRLARLRGQAELVEVRQSDLALTREEIEDFLKQISGVSLAKDEVQTLFHATEGWVAGLQILTSSIRDGADLSSLVGELGAKKRYLRDYLAEEVVARLDAPMLEFLERCSILERLSAELCGAVTGRGDSRALLAMMDRQNLFVSPIDEEHRWFRLHHLFAELLSARLAEEHGEELPMLHRRASDWYLAHDQPIEAIDHLLASGDPEAAAELIDERGEWLMKVGELKVATKWIRALPREVSSRYPAIVFLQAWAGIEEGRPLEQIERDLDSLGGRGAFEAQILCLRSYLAGLRGKAAEALALSEEACRRIEEGNLFVNGHAKFRLAVARLVSGMSSEAIDLLESAAEESLRAGNLLVAAAALTHEGRALVELGEIERGERSYQRALDLGINFGSPRRGYAAWGLIGLAEISRLRGDIDGALELFGEGMTSLANWLDLNAFSTSLGIAHALLSKGRESEALDALKSAEGLASRSTIPLYFARLTKAHRALILLRRGRIEEARACLGSQDSTDALDAEASYIEAIVSDQEILARARLNLAEGKPRECFDAALSVARRARNRKRELSGYLADLVLTQAYWKTEEIEQALATLERALSFAAERGLTQPFVDEGTAMARILYRARASGLDHPFIGKLLALFPLEEQSRAAAETRHGSFEALSPREAEILTLLSQGLSNKEVAATLYLSVRTVKWYTSSIYAKLDVSSRTQAIARARQLEILPD